MDGADPGPLEGEEGKLSRCDKEADFALFAFLDADCDGVRAGFFNVVRFYKGRFDGGSSR